jgi:hypothetical protein
MEAKGFVRPGEDAMTDETRDKIAEIRRQAEAKLAEVEILYSDKRQLAEPQADEEYRRDRRRIEDDRERKIEKLRQPG